MPDDIRFNSEGGIVYTHNGQTKIIPNETVPDKLIRFSAIARLYDTWGWHFRVDATPEEEVRRGEQSSVWNVIDRGNLIRIAAATETAASQFRSIDTVSILAYLRSIHNSANQANLQVHDIAALAHRINKLMPRVERVIKLFETVLRPVAKQVEERDG